MMAFREKSLDRIFFLHGMNIIILRMWKHIYF